nr:hypothetical protein [Tanacetum cinerariifolium]
MAKTINGEAQLHAKVDGKKIIITESSFRRDLWLENEEGIDCLANFTTFAQIALMGDPTDNVVDEAVHKELGDSLVRVATTASSLEAEQDSGNITKTQSKAIPNESSSQGSNSSGGPCYYKTMGDTTTQTWFESVPKHSNDSLLATEKTRITQQNETATQQQEIASLKRRVKKLEKKNRLRNHRLKRLYKVGLSARVESSDNEEGLGEDASKQRRINAIDADEDITLVSAADKKMFDVNVLGGEEVFVVGQNDNVVEEAVDAAQVNTAAITGKGIIIEEPMKPKKKDQFRLDEEVALKLQAGFDEQERLTREKAKKEQEANIALIETWDDIQAKLDADHQLAERMQA